METWKFTFNCHKIGCPTASPVVMKITAENLPSAKAMLYEAHPSIDFISEEKIVKKTRVI